MTPLNDKGSKLQGTTLRDVIERIDISRFLYANKNR